MLITNLFILGRTIKPLNVLAYPYPVETDPCNYHFKCNFCQLKKSDRY